MHVFEPFGKENRAGSFVPVGTLPYHVSDEEESLMYKSRQLFISSIIVYIFILALLLSGCGGQSNAEETISGYSAEETATLSEGRSGSIRWTRFSEHNYTFSLDEGRHEYAWYVLNAEDEPLYEVAYNDEPNFFFSFTAPEEVCVKGFVRT